MNSRSLQQTSPRVQTDARSSLTSSSVIGSEMTGSESLGEERQVASEDGPWFTVPIHDDSGETAVDLPLLQPAAITSPADARACFGQRIADQDRWTEQVLAAARAAGQQDLSLQDWLTGHALPRRETDNQVVMQVFRALHVLIRGEQQGAMPACLRFSVHQRQFVPLKLPLEASGFPARRSQQLCAELVALADVPMRLLLLSLSALGDTSLDIAELARVLHMELQYGLVNRQPVDVRAGCQDALRVLLNGVREGGAHVLAGWAVRAAISAAGSQPAVMGLSALASAAATVGSVYYLYKNATPQYWMQPMSSMTALMGVAAVSGLVSVIAGGVFTVVSSAAEVPTAQALIVINLARVLRQVLQTYSQSACTAGVVLVHDDGTPLSAHEQFRLNLIRDALFVVSSLALLGGASVSQLKQALAGLSDITGLSAGFLASGINEMIDGWNPELARMFYACFNSDLVLIPGKQAAFLPNFGNGIRHFMDQTASRAMLAAPADLLNALSLVLRHLGQSNAATAVSFAAAAVVGGLGGLRARALGYMRGDQIVEENGTRNPVGLVSAVGHLMRRGMHAVMPCSPAEPSWLAEARDHERQLGLTG